SRPSMTMSAPAFRAAALRYSTMSVAITFAAPDAFASLTWRRPATPLPMTATVAPGRSPAKRWPRTPQASGSTKTPSSSDNAFGDFRGDLVAEDEGRLRFAVPLHHVGAADPARANLDEDLSGPDLRLRQIDDPHVVVRVIHRGAHGAPTSSASRP